MAASMGGAQERLNERVWSRGDFVRAYASRTLRVPEVLLLVRHREAFSGRVLELGCGAGRVTGYLVELARELRGIDVSAAMVAYCGARYPGGFFDVADMRDLSGFARASFDVVFAGYNVIDVLDDDERRRVLREAGGLLAPGGLLVFSSHNRAHIPLMRRPLAVEPTRNPLRLAYHAAAIPLDLWNHRRLRRFERDAGSYAIVNDEAHHYTLLHYYIDRDEQERQLGEAGLELLECLDLDGRVVPPGTAAAESSELHYVARPRA